MKQEYYFKDGEFIIENFDEQRTFTSFLPAIAGKKGIPSWAFYVNRGQGMSSFGVQDKNGSILEFFPAYTAYQVVNKIGFRTFIKLNGKVYEIFSVNNKKAQRNMYIQREQFRIEEINKELGLRIIITYFGLPNENLASLVRKVEIENYNKDDLDIEVIDGLSQVLLPGVDNGSFKVMSNLYRSWMDVFNLENDTAFYRLRAAIGDAEEVKEATQGNFYLSFVDEKLIKPIVDPFLVFENDKQYNLPKGFIKTKAEDLHNQPQHPQNKVPCGFTAFSYHLKAGQSLRINTLIGKMHSMEAFNEVTPRLVSNNYIDVKQKENIEVVETLMDDVQVETANQLFNEYIKNTYLDNILRGGYPFIFKAGDNKQFIYYLYSRRHGDPERDYNFFHIAPEYYSQGNGNFRDICQNRRNDSLMNREVKDYNLNYFLNLVQLDGYNPLGINGATFELLDPSKKEEIVNHCFNDKNDLMLKLLSGKFTPGTIVNTVENNKIICKLSEDEYLSKILLESKQNGEANFGEGFWSDHFTYLIDLWEAYLAIYPDYEKEAMFNNLNYKYFESPASVNPRSAKTVLTNRDVVRQYGALNHHDEIKIKTFNLNPHVTNWAKNKNGEVLTTNLFSKFLTLAVNKFALLDNHGIGIEMEGGRPGWNDAMNGLPGLFGSGVSETFETLRIIRTLINIGEKNKNESAYLPHEFNLLFKKIVKLLKESLNDFTYWDLVSTAREEYRESLRYGISNTIQEPISNLLSGLHFMEKKLENAIKKAYEIGNGIYPTFITYEVTNYEPVLENGQPKIGYKNMKIVKPLSFKLRLLPNFLEAPARSFKVVKDKTLLKKMYEDILKTDIYDAELGMYKTSGNLDLETNEIGRVRAFTKGWLERESNFMHMTYKYLYGLLKAGLYNEFYTACKTNLVCNMNPKVYGRSPLEASSFIATSNNPDPELHGQGFVARMSGTTAEMLSIYLTMMTGGQPFVMQDNQLTLNLAPKLHKSFFNEKGEISFTFLKDIKVTYITENVKHTYAGLKPISYELIGKKVKQVKEVKGQDAEDLRNGKYTALNVYLS